VALLAFSALMALLANFISSTVAAVILLPLVATVGQQLGHLKLMVMLCTLMDSGAMGLPVSSFPNANSMAAGAGVLQTGDYVRTGFPMAAFVALLVNTGGRWLAQAYGW
jgi:di/tricarboxylate transporter